MRVALDFRMANHTGIGRSLRSVLPHLTAEDPDLELLLLVPDDVDPPSPMPRNIERTRWINAPKPFSWDEQWAFEKLAKVHSFDLLHIPYFHAPLFSGPPTVLTVYDLAHIQFPEECPSYAAHLYAKNVLPLVARRARRLITPSHTVTDEIHLILGVPLSKITTAPLGAPTKIPSLPEEEAREAREALGITGKYLLSVGMQRPRKNLVRLVRAFHRSHLQDVGVQLVLAGPKDPRGAEIAVEIRKLGLTQSVLQTDFVEDPVLGTLYAGAEGLIVPSLHEGFGFGPLEAWAHKLPVATAKAGALPEVCGTAVEYFDPLDEAAIARALNFLASASEDRLKLIDLGVKRRKQFDWKTTAQKMVEAYRLALR